MSSTAKAPAGSAPGAPRWFDASLSFAVIVLPVALAVARASGSAQWRGDMAVVRDEGLISVGLGGTITTALNQLVMALPLGSRTFRSALGAAFVLGLAAHLVWRLARRLLAARLAPESDATAPGSLPKLASLLCAVAATGAALAPTFQAEATVGGGVIVAAALGLGCFERLLAILHPRASSFTPESSRRWLVLAALLGALLAENLPAGIGTALACAGGCAAARKRPPTRLRWALAGFAVAALVACVVPALIRPMAPRSLGDVGRALADTGLGHFDGGSHALPGIFAWAHELGWIALGIAACGAVFAIARRDTRVMAVPLLCLVVADIFYPKSAATASLAADPLAALRLLAIAALAVIAAIGMAEVVAFLLRLKLPLARGAAVLTVAFHITVVAVSSEEAGFVSNRRGLVAAEEWTDAALAALPPNAALLIDTPAVAWRVWAARIARGERPDVAVVPAPLLRRGYATSELIAAEPAISLVLRDIALGGVASEYALSALADARPLYVELGDGWDDWLVSHLVPEGAWLRYMPEVIGRDEREELPDAVYAETGRLVTSLDAGPARDDATANIVARALKEHAAALALVGMRRAVQATLGRVAAVLPEDPFVTGARLRVAFAESTHARGAVELRDLLRY